MEAQISDDSQVPPEELPCPTCRIATRAPAPSGAEVEEVHCVRCGRVLRRRPPLTAELRAQALVLRWAALQLEQRITTSHRRKLRHDSGEAYDQGLEFAAEQLRQWARTIHRRPAPREEVVERPRASLSGRVPL